MALSPEWLLGFALIAIYLFDSVHFLRIGEAVVITAHGSLSGLSFGSSMELGGRRPYLPNPLTPGWPELRIDWSTSTQSSTAQQAATEMKQQLRALRPIGWLACTCASLIVLAAPLALLAGQQQAFVISVGLCVACVALAGTLIVLRRRQLGLSLGQAAAIWVVALVCLPCSGNLARAVAIRRQWTVRASELLSLDFARSSALKDQVRDMLARAQRLCAEESREYQSIAAELQRLEERANEHH